MGFTEAELGFVVAALFAAVAVATLNDRDIQANGSGALQIQIVDLQAGLKSTKAELEDTQRKLEQAEEELALLREAKNRQSTKTSQCWEKGKQKAAIGDVIVLGENSYSLQGETADIDLVRERFAT